MTFDPFRNGWGSTIQDFITTSPPGNNSSAIGMYSFARSYPARRVPPGFEEPHVGIAQVVSGPVGADEGFGLRIGKHIVSPLYLKTTRGITF